MRKEMKQNENREKKTLRARSKKIELKFGKVKIYVNFPPTSLSVGQPTLSSKN